QGDGPDRLPATMREILFKSLTVRGFINYDFAADLFPAFLREVGSGVADGRIRYREDFVDGLERAPEAFIGMLEGRNFGKLIVRVGGWACGGSRVPGFQWTEDPSSWRSRDALHRGFGRSEPLVGTLMHEKNRVLVLEASDTLSNERDYAAAEPEGFEMVRAP